jgi:hypothetical protein
MTDLLVDFIAKLSTDAEIAKKYKADPAGAMTDFGVSEADQQLLLSGDTAAIKKRFEDAGSPIQIIGSIT